MKYVENNTRTGKALQNYKITKSRDYTIIQERTHRKKEESNGRIKNKRKNKPKQNKGNEEDRKKEQTKQETKERNKYNHNCKTKQTTKYIHNTIKTTRKRHINE